MIIPKKKICVECKEESYIFSRKCCRSCWNKLYSKALKRISNGKKIKNIEKGKLLEQDKIFYMKVWNSRPHVCENCTAILSQPLLQYFHHILFKAQYPQYRHCSWNIALCCWECHDKTHRNEDLTPYLKKRRLELLELIGDE